MKIFATLLFLSMASCGHALEATQAFTEANQAYAAGDFIKARTSYEALIRQGDLGANVFYNLANAAWRMGDSGAAALNYERALLWQRDHPEASDNLKLVREKSRAKVFMPERWDFFFPNARANTFLLSGIVCAWLLLFAVIAICLRVGRTTSAWIAGLALLTGAYCGVGWRRSGQEMQRAIVVARSAEARYAPLDNSPLVETLPAASEVRILQMAGAWTYCLLPTHSRAWIPSPALAPLLPSRS